MLQMQHNLFTNEEALDVSPTIANTVLAEGRVADSSTGFTKGYSKFYYHFADRLKLRYGLTITEMEYVSLCRKTKFEIIAIKNDQRIINIDFKGNAIKAVKQSKERGIMLITALR